MLKQKRTAYKVKATGSELLRTSLKAGDIKAIAAHFKRPYQTVYYIIAGRHYGDKNIVECAEKIVSFYEKAEISKKVTQIIESYEITN